MKTIGYLDRVEGKTIKAFNSPNDSKNKLNIFNFKRINRIQEAFKELKNMGNIEVYLLQGNKQRLLFTR